MEVFALEEDNYNGLLITQEPVQMKDKLDGKRMKRQLYLGVEGTDFGALVSSILKEVAIVYLNSSDSFE